MAPGPVAGRGPSQGGRLLDPDCPCGGRQHGVRIRPLKGDPSGIVSSPCWGGVTPGWASSSTKVVGAVADVEVKPAVGAEEDVGSPAAAAVSSSGSPRGWAVSIASVEIR